jgi:hypothetical protein
MQSELVSGVPVQTAQASSTSAAAVTHKASASPAISIRAAVGIVLCTFAGGVLASLLARGRSQSAN